MLDPKEFLKKYYAANRPVDLAGCLADWPAMGKWSIAALAERFADRPVEVMSGRATNAPLERSRQISALASRIPVDKWGFATGC